MANNMYPYALLITYPYKYIDKMDELGIRHVIGLDSYCNPTHIRFKTEADLLSFKLVFDV